MFLWIAAFGVDLLTLAGYLSRRSWILDLTSHFRLQYFLYLSACTILFALGGRWDGLLVAIPGALINLVELLPFKKRNHPPKTGVKTYRVLSANVLQPSRGFEQVRRLIQAEQPDFITLVEVNQEWIDALQPVALGYPYITPSLRNDNYGLAILSRYPIDWSEVRNFSSEFSPSAIARFKLEGQRLTIIVTHPPPPKSKELSAIRDRHLEHLSEYVRSLPGNVMVCGDLNISPWSGHYKDFLRSSCLIDSRIGFGLFPSWPTDRPYLMIPIDHVLYSAKIAVHNRRSAPRNKSDHLPVVVDFFFVSVIE